MPFDTALALFWLKKLAAALILPPLSPLLLVAVGLIVARRHRRGGHALAWGGVALALFFSSPASVGWLVRGLETAPAVSAETAAQAQAIIVLGGGKRRYAPEYGGETLNRLALERARYGATLARQTGLPVLVSGGAPTGDVPEAELLRTVIENEFGVPVRWVERASRDTRENARFAAVQLHAAGIQRILLVTHAAHMPRAQAEFAAQGFDVIPAPTAWFSGRGSAEQVVDFLPSATSAFAGWVATHEWLGLLAYRLTR